MDENNDKKQLQKDEDYERMKPVKTFSSEEK
jgi:hypothetical protein